MRRPDLHVNECVEAFAHSAFHQRTLPDTTYCPVHTTQIVWARWDHSHYVCWRCPEPIFLPLTYKCYICDPSQPMPPDMPIAPEVGYGWATVERPNFVPDTTSEPCPTCRLYTCNCHVPAPPGV